MSQPPPAGARTLCALLGIYLYLVKHASEFDQMHVLTGNNVRCHLKASVMKANQSTPFYLLLCVIKPLFQLNMPWAPSSSRPGQNNKDHALSA